MNDKKEKLNMINDSVYIKDNIMRTLLYYDIFNHPLKEEELFNLLPFNSISKSDIISLINKFSKEDDCLFTGKNGYVYIKPNTQNVSLRLEKERYSIKMWKITRIITHVIKRFPFVRCVLVTGSLSKNSSFKGSDLDFMVVTTKNRLWIARTMLMLFKKLFLFNSHKYFCINYFVSEEMLEIEEKNLFTATEIVHIKATFNTELMNEFINRNKWIKEYFPNYKLGDSQMHSTPFKVNNRRSILQKFLELFFYGRSGDRLDKYLREKTSKYFKKKYRFADNSEHSLMFKSTANVSKTHPRNMQKQILNEYHDKLRKFNLV
jgi:hypothetical protein